MRVNLITQSSGATISSKASFPVTLTIRPSCGVPGEYQYSTDSTALLRMLRQETDLPGTVIGRFEEKLFGSTDPRLLGVELSERTLTSIGYFLD